MIRQFKLLYLLLFKQTRELWGITGKIPKSGLSRRRSRVRVSSSPPRITRVSEDYTFEALFLNTSILNQVIIKNISLIYLPYQEPREKASEKSEY